MKFLLEIPLVLSFAEWVWTVDDDGVAVVAPEDASESTRPKYSAELCLSTLPLMNGDCWKRLIVKGLGVAIILGACLNKAPVIRNILANRAAAGLSRNAVYGETLMYANSAAYGLLSAFPFSAYGENAALLLQSVVIVFLTWQFATPPGVSITERGTVVAVVAVYLTVVPFLLTESHYYLLMTSIMPILLVSRGSQIIETYRCQHTGAQSILTTTMNLVGGLIRILTTIQEVGWDFAVLGTFGLSLILNCLCFGQHFYYQSNTQKFLAELQQQGAQKKVQ